MTCTFSFDLVVNTRLPTRHSDVVPGAETTLIVGSPLKTGDLPVPSLHAVSAVMLSAHRLEKAVHTRDIRYLAVYVYDNNCKYIITSTHVVEMRYK